VPESGPRLEEHANLVGMTMSDVAGGTNRPEAREGVRFLDPTARVRLQSAVEAAGWTLAAPRRLDASARGALRERIEEAIESMLERRGAPASGLGVAADADMILSDQLYRARQVGVSGIIVALESLAALVGPSGALCEDDSATIRFFADAGRTRSIGLWLSPADMALPVYGPPVPLHVLVSGSTPASPGTTVSLARPREQAAQAPREGAPVGGPPWHEWVRLLEDAQGPKPLAAIEKLFVEAYTPLADAVSRRQADDQARQCVQQFRTSFERSYTDAFGASKVTRKRPTMVLDVPQISSRVARLHGARTVSLVLVDGMRWDVGLHVQRILAEHLAGRAVLAERMVLWAALPSTTPMQLRLLSRGPQGLSEVVPDKEMREKDIVVPRGRTAAVMRRIRIAGRELHKLDVIPSLLADPGAPEPARIEALGEAVAAPIAKFAAGLETRTLLFVFGDHGFTLSPSDGGTGPGEEGGAYPEQVLVPAQAWLVGGVH